MKILKNIAVAATIALPFSIAPIASAMSDGNQVSIQADQAVEDAALYLAYTARTAQSFVESELDSSVTRFYYDKAVRLSRTMNIQALDMASLAQAASWDQAAVDELFADIELTYFQIDSTKRTLARRYSSQADDIEDVFNRVRTAFYNMKLEIYGEI